LFDKNKIGDIELSNSLLLEFVGPNKSLRFESVGLFMTLMQLRDDKICTAFNNKNKKSQKIMEQTLFVSKNIFPELERLVLNQNVVDQYRNMLRNDLKLQQQGEGGYKPRRVLLPIKIVENGTNNRDYSWCLICVDTEKKSVWLVDPQKRYYDNTLPAGPNTTNNSNNNEYSRVLGTDEQNNFGRKHLNFISVVLRPFLGHLFADIQPTEWKFDLLPVDQQAMFPALTSQYDSGIYVLIICYLLSQDIPLCFDERDLIPFKKNVVYWLKNGELPIIL